MYTVRWSPKAAKYLDNLPKDVAERISEKIDKVLENPFRFIEHFEGECYKLRIGDYRALIDIDFENKIMRVRVFDKRGRIY